MADPERAFSRTSANDEDLAMEVAARLGITLPEPCIAGVAHNARLLQRHLDVLRESAE